MMKSVEQGKYRWLLVLFGIGLIGLSLYALFFYFKNQHYYGNSDVFYYVSLSRNAIEHGRLLNTTVIPSEPVRTPQNAIVGLYMLLEIAGIHPPESFIVISVFYFLLQWLALIPLWKIADECGLDALFPKLALVLVYIGNWNMNFFQYAPLNDGLFCTGTLWFLFFMLEVGKDLNCHSRFSKRGWIFGCFALLTGVVLIHFRLNAIILPVAGFAAALLTGKYRQSVFWTGLFAVMLVSLGSFYLFVETSQLSQASDKVFTNYVFRFPKIFWEFIQMTIPGTFLKPLGTSGNCLFAGFLIAFLIGLWQGIQKKHFTILLITMICMGTMTFLLLLPRAPYRMMMVVFPLFYLLILWKPCTRPIGYLFVFAVIMQSLMIFYDAKPLNEMLRFWKHVSHEVKMDAADGILVTNKPRQSYYFFGMSGLKNNVYTWQDLIQAEQVYLAGHDEFIKQQQKKMEELADQANVGIECVSLTPNYSDSLGHALLHIRIKEEP